MKQTCVCLVIHGFPSEDAVCGATDAVMWLSLEVDGADMCMVSFLNNQECWSVCNRLIGGSLWNADNRIITDAPSLKNFH